MSVFEITIQRKDDDAWPVVVRHQPATYELALWSRGRLDLDLEAFVPLLPSDKAYGLLLGKALFRDDIRDAFVRAVAEAKVADEPLRVLLNVEADDLRRLHWEQSCAPLDSGWDYLLLNQGTPFSLYLPSQIERRFQPIGRRDLRALVLVAGPEELDGDYQLVPFDTAATVRDIQYALGEIPCDVLATLEGTIGPPTLNALCKHLTAGGYTLLHLVCHGAYLQESGETLLYLPKNEDGRPVQATTLIERLGRLDRLPHFTFLSTCESADPQAEAGLGGVGQRLVRELGMPAVVAMTDRISIDTAEALASAFYTRLSERGEVDCALCEAMAGLQGRYDVTVPALFSRLGGRALWSDTLDRPLTDTEIRHGLELLPRLLQQRAPILLHELKDQSTRILASLGAEVAALSAETRHEHAAALTAVNQLCSKALDLSFNALALGQRPPDYDSRCPFPGLSAFGAHFLASGGKEQDDREFFFGREALIERLKEKLAEHNFLPILGPSGSGKSSLVVAGLIPALQEDEPRLQMAYLTPGSHPLPQLPESTGLYCRSRLRPRSPCALQPAGIVPLHPRLAAGGLRQRGANVTPSRRVLWLMGLTLVTLLVGGCSLRATEPPIKPSPTLFLTRTPTPTVLPTPTRVATPIPSLGRPQWYPASQGIPAQIGVAAVAVAPSDPLVIYLAAYEPGGLYRSDDGGESWQPIRGGLASLAPIALAVHPADSDAIWVGTVAGAYGTTDGDQSWQPVASLLQMPVYALAFSQDGVNLYAGGEAPGVWRSIDGGQTWSFSELAHTQSSVLSLAVASNGTVFAGTAGQGMWASQDGVENWQPAGSALTSAHVTTLRPLDDGRLYALADGDLYLSSDRGDTWQMVGPPQFEALSFTVESARSDRIYLGSKGDALAVSLDGGASWSFAGDGLRHADITCLVTDPDTPGLVYLGTQHNGLYRTTDAGKSWKLISGDVGKPVVAALAQDPTNSQVLYAGTLDGVYRSEDGGEHWRLISGPVGKVFVQGLVVSSTGEDIYAGTRTGIYRSEDGGATWRWVEDDTGAIAVFNILVDPHDEDHIYAGSWGHNVLRSIDGGQTWAPIHHGLETLSVHAFAVDPTDPQVLYAGTVEAVYRSTDGGQSWQASPLTNRPVTTFALVVDPVKPTLLFAGTTEGVYGSNDGGQTWQAVGHEDLDVTVTALQLNPTDPLTLYAGTEHHGLFRSTDGGEHWQPWGLEDASVYAILVDRAGTVWVGTDWGIFRNR